MSTHPLAQVFTREDVTRHRNRAAWYREHLDQAGEPDWDFPLEEMESKRRHGDWHESMADRIEALLEGVS